ncbi:MAG: type II and III secretion system protein family protein, partial [Bryobacteraceae bacterium]
QDVSVDADKDVVFLHGTVNDLVSSNRAAAIAAALGKTVNLLNVKMPPGDEQILLKVRFADVDRTKSANLGVNLFSTGATNTIGGLTTQQFSPPVQTITGSGKAASTATTLSNALNIFLYRPDLNLGATIAALEARNVLQILAEPNVLAINGKEASFLAGGEFPYPTVQSGSAGGALAITIQFKEFGIKLKFTPVITPRGTIRLVVAPEVSSLDYSNGLTYQGFSIPALSTRKVQTEIELRDGQSFAIAGLLDNQITEILDKVPGLGDIPLLGKLFQSRQDTKSNTELLIVVTPEIVHPIPAGAPRPHIEFPKDFLKDVGKTVPGAPSPAGSGTASAGALPKTVPVETLLDERQRGQGSQSQAAPAPAGNR